MNILIITGRRTGGSNFGKWISMECDLKYIYEPDIKTNFVKDEIVAKVIYEKPEDENEIKNIAKKFDKIIIHKRLDIVKQSESLVYSQINNVFTENYTIKDSFIEKNKKLIDVNCNMIKICNDNMDRFNFGIHTIYEEIFSDEYDWNFLLNYLEIKNPKYIHFLNKRNKHRDTKKEKLI